MNYKEKKVGMPNIKPRICKTCKETKPTYAFFKSGKSGDGYQKSCKACNTHKSRERRRRKGYKTPVFFSKENVRRKAVRKEVSRYKLERGCDICGANYHPSILDCHHKDPSKKKKNVSQMLTSKWETILKELKKCAILCKNCHFILHAEDSGDEKYEDLKAKVILINQLK